jgi:hypothetical protein
MSQDRMSGTRPAFEETPLDLTVIQWPFAERNWVDNTISHRHYSVSSPKLKLQFGLIWHDPQTRESRDASITSDFFQDESCSDE